MNILFVCTGNTCRSPMAERYLESKNIPNLRVESRGLSAEGGSVSANAITVMAEAGIDLSSDVSCGLTAADLVKADKIFYMSPAHFTVLSLYAPKEKLFILGGGISDPFGGDCDRYRGCRDEIFSAIDSLVEEGFFEETVILRADQSLVSSIGALEKECFSTPWSDSTIKEAMDSTTVFFISQRGKRVIGYIGITCILDEGYITNLAVGGEFRQQGVGRALLNRALSHAADMELSFVSLEVRESNQNAIRLYSSSGFKEEGRRKNFYTLPTEDALILTKRF